MSEIWRPYFDTSYEVSDAGNVRRNGKVLKQTYNSHGYKYVDIWHNNLRSITLVHRMVAFTFVSGYSAGLIVNHRDGVKANNACNNLEWVTHSDNNLHATANGLASIGSERVNAVLDEDSVFDIKIALSQGISNQELATLYSVSSGTISEIRIGNTWKHVPGPVLSRSGPNPIKKLSPADIPIIRRRIAAGEGDSVICKSYGVARGTISQIRHGKTWINY